jgi:hypothetical protein
MSFFCLSVSDDIFGRSYSEAEWDSGPLLHSETMLTITIVVLILNAAMFAVALHHQPRPFYVNQNSSEEQSG